MSTRGRPRNPDPTTVKNAVVTTAMTEAERDLVRAAAEADSMTVSEWVRARAVTSAKRAARRT